METTPATAEVIAIFDRINLEGEKMVKDAQEFWSQFSNNPILPMTASEK
ncbi:hypothetical protein N8533_01310 [Akkermansiaceae bacterium]|nr:hypothetical protein [Akkermansiaceae bacterium]